MQWFTATEKLKKFFWHLGMFDVCTTGDTAHVYKVIKFLPHTRQHGCFLLEQTPSFSKLFIPRTNGLVCRRFFAYFARSACCTVTTDLLVWYSNTQNDFCPGAAIRYIHSHRLAAEMWTAMQNNLLGKNVLSCSFYLYRFRKYVSYGFPIINFCNPGVHYEKPCIMSTTISRLLYRYSAAKIPFYLLVSICLYVQK